MGTEMAAVLPGLTRDQCDPLRSPVLQRELPGLATALDEQAMRGRLQALLFGEDSPYRIERCNPGQAIYLAGDFCGLRYELEVRGPDGGPPIELLAVGRVFQHEDARRAFLSEKLAPVAEQARGRPDLAPFARLVAPIDELNMAVHVFPIDGDLPALLDVTDPSRAAELVGAALGPGFTPRECRVQLVQYGRRHRCTLRYVLDGADASGAPAQQVVYGKVASDGTGARTVPVIAALHERLQAAGAAGQVQIPRVLAFLPEQQLLLLEAIPGRPQIARLLKERLAGQSADGPLTLESGVEACGLIAAAIHRSGVALGRRRALEDELDWLAGSIAALARVSPELGARLREWLERAAAAGRAAEPLPLCFSHGDFTYTQLIFDGARTGLVDFDTVCQAEPALDLGQFLAYQRLAIHRNQRPESPMTAAAVDRLCDGFFDTYAAAMGVSDVRRLRARVRVYEILMLLRLAVHSWQKLKVSRLEHATALIEERIAWLH